LSESGLRILSEPGCSGLLDFQDLPHQRFLMCAFRVIHDSEIGVANPYHKRVGAKSRITRRNTEKIPA